MGYEGYALYGFGCGLLQRFERAVSRHFWAPASMAHYPCRSRTRLSGLIVDGVNGWIYNANSATFGVITDGNFFSARTVTFFDDYFVFERMGTNEFFCRHSSTAPHTTGLDFASAAVTSANNRRHDSEPSTPLSVLPRTTLSFGTTPGLLIFHFNAMPAASSIAGARLP